MCTDTLYGQRLNDERLCKPSLQHVKRESVFHELYNMLTRKRKCAGITVIISQMEQVFFFFTVKLDPTNSFPSNTAEV